MVTGEVRRKVDRVWEAFWSGGIANPLEVVEQLTLLLFLKRLDDLSGLHTAATEHLRWGRFSRLGSAEEMLRVVRDEVFPWVRGLGGDDSTYARHMRDARFTIPTATLLAKAVDMVDELPTAGRDTKGDLYEYMLGKIATSGQNGQFRTPRHIIRLIVEMMSPGPDDVICDPACGTAGFLAAAAEYVRPALRDAGQRRHFTAGMFHGFDFDRTMLRIASMNMLLHGVGEPDIRYRDSLAEAADGGYSMILANPPFAGTLDHESVAEDLRGAARTRKTELLFLVLILRLLAPGGRAAVIVPDGVLFGSSKAHRDLRRMLVDDHRLEAVVKLPTGAFKPYAGVSTAILFFTRTDGGGTERVWFYDVTADGFSLDDKRAPLLDADKLGPTPATPLTPDEHALNNLPDLLHRWKGREVTEKSFCVSREEIASQAYDLSPNRYRREVAAPRTHRRPAEILEELESLESEIQQGLSDLKEMLR